MIVNNWLLGSNPFVDAYVNSDFLGKGIFISLILLSLCTWVVLIYKVRTTHQVGRLADSFQKQFQLIRDTPLNLDCAESQPHPFLSLYVALKGQTIDILNKNRRFTQTERGKESPPCLSQSDIDLVGSYLTTTISSQVKRLESHLYLLSTIASLGPYLGLLGTVWGILTTFSQLQTQAGMGTHQAILGGLSLALATTVLGLVDAIPALIGYNYLKNVIRNFEVEMESFANEILVSVELQYRQVDVLR